MSSGTIATRLGNMLPAKAGTATPKIIFESEDGILLAYGTTVPADGTGSTGYAKGCIFIHVDGASAGDLVFINEGTSSSADFDSTHS